MDKYEYKVRSDEIKNLIANEEYVQAAEIADTIDWKRVKSVNMLCTIGDLYKINRRYEDAKNILLLAYERRPGGRTICYSLCELCIKTEEFVQAVNYYKEFVQAAPKDSGRYILQYKLYEAQDVGLEERIGVLEELKKRDYREKWAYELAYLYHRVGLATRCVEECDELILWFGEGKYVVKAMELKMLHEPLSPSQQEKYDHRFDEPEETVEETEGQAEEAWEEHQPQGEGGWDAYGRPYGGENWDGYGRPQAEGEGEAYSQSQEAAQDAQGWEPEGQLRNEGWDGYAQPQEAGLWESHGQAEEAQEWGRSEEGAYSQMPGADQWNTPDDRQEVDMWDGGAHQEEDIPEGSEADKGDGWQERDGDALSREEQDDLDIQVKTMDVSQYNTINLQQELAAGLQEVLGEEERKDSFLAVQAEEPQVAEASKRKGSQTAAIGKIVQVVTDDTGAMTGGVSLDHEYFASGQPEEEQDYVRDDTAELVLAQMRLENERKLLRYPGSREDTRREKGRTVSEAGQKEREVPVESSVPETWRESGSPAQEMWEESGSPVQETWGESGSPVQETWEESGSPVTGTWEESGSPVQGTWEESGSPVTGTWEENGSPVTGTWEESGSPVTGTWEESESPVTGTWGEGGSPIQERRKEESNGSIQETSKNEADNQGGGWISENNIIEKQITGQIKIEDILAEWEQTKRDSEEKYKEEIRQDVLRQTGPMFTEFEAAVRDGLLERLEKGEEADLEGLQEFPKQAEAARKGETGSPGRKRRAPSRESVQETTKERENGKAGASEWEELIEDIEIENLPEEPGGMMEAGEPEEKPEGVMEAGESEEEPDGLMEAGVLEEEPEDVMEAGEPEEEPDGLMKAGEPEEEPEDVMEAGEPEEEPGGLMESGEPEEKPGGMMEAGESEEEPGGLMESGESEEEPGDGLESGESEVKTGETPLAEADPVERDVAKVRSLTREEKELYAPFIQSRSARERLVQAIDNISMAAYTGNIVVTGEEGMDTMTFAKNVIREVQMTDRNFSGKVAKISGQGLNGRDVNEILWRLNNGALIIYHASGMEPRTAAALHRALQQENLGIIILMEDTKKAMQRMFLGTPELYNDFTARMDLEALSNDTLVAFGRRYAREMEYSIDTLGILALHTRIEELQTIDHVVTVVEVKKIVDEAIRHACRKTLGHFFDILFSRRYDEEDMIILTEKDFVY